MSDAEDKPSRVRTLTEKGRDLFYSNLESYVKDIDKSWKEFEDTLVNFDENCSDIKYLRRIQSSLERAKQHYTSDTELLFSFLKRYRTDESDEEMDKHLVKNERCRSIMDNFNKRIQSSLLDAAEILSEKYETRSEATISSRGSSIKSQLMRKRMEAKAQQIRLTFAEKQSELQKEKALLDAKLNLLEQQKEVATLEAEIQVLENYDSSQKSERNLSGFREPLSLSKEKFTADFVNGQTRFSDVHNTERKKEVDDNISPVPQRHQLNPYASEFREYSHSGVATDLTQFLLKKDLLLSRFSAFNDRPDTYETWKATFTAIIKELNVTPFEEMDLLVKWLGPESKRFASSIRTSNIHNPFTGLHRIWERLEERYGRPEMVEAALKQKLDSFPKVSPKEPKKLYDLLDILTEIESAKENPRYSVLLSYFDSSSGVIPIINKLPYGLQEKWVSQASKYKNQFHVPFPPFGFLVNFIREISTMKNDPALQHESSQSSSTVKKGQRENKGSTGLPSVHSRKTELTGENEENKVNTTPRCPLHKADHSLNVCRSFRAKPLQERKDILRENGFCYKCCTSKHLSRNCKATIKCELCGNSRHTTAMHPDSDQEHNSSAATGFTVDGGEKKISTKSEVDSKCTQLCGQTFSGRSCAKVVPVRVYPSEKKEHSIQMYAIVDEQSNRTLARSEFFDLFDVQNESQPYTLFSCSGRSTCSGRRAHDFVIEATDGSYQLNIPTIIECDDIPNNRQEIPTPEVANAYPHLSEIASELHPLEKDMEILLLIGRDLGEAHHVLEQRIGPPHSPYAQKIGFGWVVIGDVCLGRSHRPDVVVANKLAVLSNGRSTQSTPCPNNIIVKADVCKEKTRIPCLDYLKCHKSIGYSIFQTSEDDEKPGLSVEDREFLKIMDNNIYRDESGQWVAPLPFREPRPRLGNNRQSALKRANMLHHSLQRNPTKCEHAIAFMKRIFDAGHAELAPQLENVDSEEIWYLPIFSVYHSKKPDQIRMVFDSSAQYEGLSLNKVLLTGPDLTNSLLGVLLRFRLEKIGIMADIQQMFHCFKVRQDHRNYLRFFWYADNDPKGQLVEYRMCVHVFGNSPSPAVATYGLRKTAGNAEQEFGSDVLKFVERNFYVDDGLISLPSVDEVVSLMQRTQKALAQEGGLRLHKIVSNSNEVMKRFPVEDLAKDLMSPDLSKDSLPTQLTLGISWDLSSDSFTFNLSSDEKPYTRRGVLSCLNSFCDPLGFVTPVLIKGKLLLRKLTSNSMDWDLPLPDEYYEEWEQWKQHLPHLKDLKIPRCYFDVPSQDLIEKTVHVFTDASEEAIAAVAFLRAKDHNGHHHHGFILGKGKVAPKSAVTIPRLELCAAVLGVEISRIIKEQLDIAAKDFRFHTDSRVILGYIYNKTRRFYTYVSNRIEQIHRFSSPTQWSYVPTQHNPADQGTKPILPEAMKESQWLCGPKFWISETPSKERCESENYLPEYELIDTERDHEIRPVITSTITNVNIPVLGTSRFAKYSTWNSLVAGVSRLKHIARHWNKRKRTSSCSGWHFCNDAKDTELYSETEKLIIRNVQHEVFHEESKAIREDRAINQGSTPRKLNPVMDCDGILRVGGRLNNAKLNINYKNPIIMPGRKHPISILLIRHYHHLVKHQGRHFTDGAVRTAGFWIIGSKRLISSIIYHCVTCRKMRRKPEHQIMADLPIDRVSPDPPFTSVGVDTFGPWEIAARRTRGGIAHAKRWAIMFSCLTSRAVHIEVIFH
uniref:Uncharacterized protein LOC111129629 n=1 Tax=Crassostrea virginica TaxID=6565 RepID=A0A8B8DV85_CRAVI|nr:uncharacterized protein LOC111129629 [Crassostrea virginica]